MVTDDDAQHDYTFTFDDESGLLFNRNGWSGFFYEISPLVGFSSELEKNLTLFFNDELPEEGRLQFIINECHNDDQVSCLKMFDADGSGVGMALDIIAEDYRDFIENCERHLEKDGNGIHGRYFRVFVIYSISCAGDEKAMKNMIKFKSKFENKMKAEKFSPVLCKAIDFPDSFILWRYVTGVGDDGVVDISEGQLQEDKKEVLLMPEEVAEIIRFFEGEKSALNLSNQTNCC